MEYGLVVVWLLGLVAVAALAAPVVTRLFGQWETAGVGFALPFGLLTLGVTAFWVGRVAYGTPALAAGGVVLLGLAVGVGIDRRAVQETLPAGRPSPRTAARAVVAGLRIDRDRVQRRAVVETVGVFLFAFGFLVAVRAVDPAVLPRGGEKFLDYGLLQSLGRAGTLPPEDMWFAGEPVSYYYGGHLLSDLLARLTGTPRQFAYNLALATFFATYVTAAFDLAGVVAAAGGYSRRLAAWGAAFAVGLAANVQTGARLLLQVLPDSLRAAAVRQIQPRVEIDVTRWLSEGYWGPGRSLWASSRVIPGTINEFPLFAFLNGDLHAHMVGPTFLLLAAAFAFVLYRSRDPSRRRRVLFGLVPVVGGFQAVVHTWGFPTVFGLAWLALTLSSTPPRNLLPAVARGPLDRFVGRTATDGGVAATPSSGGGSRLGNELARPVVAAALVAGAGVIAAVLAAPFLLGTATSGSSRELAVLAVADRSSWGGLAVVHGAFLLVFGGYLLDRVGDTRPWELLAAMVLLAVTAQWLSLPAVGLVGAVLLGAWVVARTERGGFEAVLLAGGAGLVLLVEIVYLNEQAGPGRMNTVFKTYSQVWAIWAVGAGVAAATLARRVDTTTVWPSVDARRTAAVALLVVAVAGAGGYAVVTVPNHFAAGSDGAPNSAYDFAYPEEPTLDATAHLEPFHPGIAAGVRYLEDRPGRPTLLSAPGAGWYEGRGYGNPPGLYSWESNPAASLTGLPTIAGWGHEVGYRGRTAFYDRVRTVDTAYTDRAAAVATLRERDVQYVWVGAGERSRYGNELIDFETIAGVQPVVSESGVVVYRVDQSALPATDATQSRASPAALSTAMSSDERFGGETRGR